MGSLIKAVQPPISSKDDVQHLNNDVNILGYIIHDVAQGRVQRAGYSVNDVTFFSSYSKNDVAQM